MDTVQTKMFRPLSETDVGAVWVGRDSTATIGGVIDALPLKFPPGGTYFVSLEGRTLHVYETTSGISRFTTSDPSMIKSIDVDENVTRVGITGVAKVNEIIVHRECGSLANGAVQLEELSVPVGAMREYTALTAKGALTPSERARKVELLAEIKRTFAQAQQEPKRAQQHRSTPEPSGESRGGRSGGTG